MDANAARNEFDQVNQVRALDPNEEAVYRYDGSEQQGIRAAKPWKTDPNHFKKVYVSSVALVKMSMHAHSGGDLEVMGLMQGKVEGESLIILDSFALPVEGTETRVNASNEANEYIVSYLEEAKTAGRLENAIGWYHSHPGYGCWLSGIDVSTQMINQQFQEPWVAVVIDPKRTVASGKVDIGAFRTYPKEYKPEHSRESAYQTIPLEKVEDFGVHADAYYSLDVSYFKSSLDTQLLDDLWKRYWVEVLSQSPVTQEQEYMSKQMRDVGGKAERMIRRGKDKGNSSKMAQGKEGNAMEWPFKDASKMSIELSLGLLSQSTRRSLL
ncbi:Mov34/MPN/PAD-1 family protein [Piptocephalis cylindrospora]|uniref:COP9 signalosome complex subunit 5 n=1 Tax=Piptocephalis cylindrospora TaxID=1907219 RepID=A0A4P9Y9E6_9FUNG|nr:Mov34/MPN/PAD-1 family protein [Piptocephalis cylindrospora]|eukprot:RKP15041.1 Mov34/MPN/PAD-1 family protein [Piptocephalis cylindrospora]